MPTQPSPQPFDLVQARETLRDLARTYWSSARQPETRAALRFQIDRLREHGSTFQQCYQICYDVARPTWDDFTQMLFSKIEPAAPTPPSPPPPPTETTSTNEKPSAASSQVRGKIPSTRKSSRPGKNEEESE